MPELMVNTLERRLVNLSLVCGRFSVVNYTIKDLYFQKCLNAKLILNSQQISLNLYNKELNLFEIKAENINHKKKIKVKNKCRISPIKKY